MMAEAAPAAPLLLGGPPGWFAYGVIVVGSAIATGIVVNEMTKDHARTTSATTTDTARQICRAWTVRVHARGMDCGGTTKSTIGVPAYANSKPITIAEGIIISNAMWSLLTKSQKKIRIIAKAKLEAYVLKHPPINTERTFPATDPSGGKRYDTGNYGRSPNFIV